MFIMSARNNTIFENDLGSTTKGAQIQQKLCGTLCNLCVSYCLVCVCFVTRGCRRNLARGLVALHPAHRARDAHLEPLGRRVTRQTALDDGFRHPFAKDHRKALFPLPPSRGGNHELERDRFGKSQRFSLLGDRSSVTGHFLSTPYALPSPVHSSVRGRRLQRRAAT